MANKDTEDQPKILPCIIKIADFIRVIKSIKIQRLTKCEVITNEIYVIHVIK
jgi:hypothetical protein